MFICRDCFSSFSETKNTFLAGLKKPVSNIWQVIKAKTEGGSLNATCRVFDIAKNTLLSWERKFTGIYYTLFICSMAHAYIEMLIEGDEFYTKVHQNLFMFGTGLQAAVPTSSIDRVSRVAFASVSS